MATEDPDGDPSTPPPEHGFGMNFGVAFGGSTGRPIVHNVRARGLSALNVTANGRWADVDASGEFDVNADVIGVSGLDVQAPVVSPLDVSAAGDFSVDVTLLGLFSTGVVGEGLFDVDTDAPGQVRSELFE